MVSISIWLIAIVLESAPLVRAVRCGFTKHYKFFYTYLGFILLRDLGLLGVYFLASKAYAWSYWSTELVGVVLGCGLVWETYKIALAEYRGAARMARHILPVLFILTAARILVEASLNSNWIPGRTPLEAELDLRIVQVALLFGLLILLAYYAIPLGRNLRGIVCGYALFLVTNLAGLIFREEIGQRFQGVWQYLQPGSYLAVLSIWCWAMWSYAPAPQPEHEPELETDYEALLATTKWRLRILRSRVTRGIQP